jgi:hypothetical protein
MMQTVPVKKVLSERHKTIEFFERKFKSLCQQKVLIEHQTIVPRKVMRASYEA